MAGACFSCGKSLNLGAEVGRREECPSCRADVHVCKNCTWYDRSAYNECREPQADVVREKDRSNFCDYFKIGDKSAVAGPSKEDLRAQAEALFKNFGKKS
ncbi:MAG: hypothetical protein RJB66_1466 [Pseudomonadota bacterium]